MGTEIVKNYYCNSCQPTSQYPNSISISLEACATAGETITPDVYNEIFSSLNSIRDFGDYDDNTRQPDTSGLTTKIIHNEINTNYYNDIAAIVKSNYQSKNTADIIYGSYFTDLQALTRAYQVPSSRYYKTTKDCCDCYGQCSCYGECGCYGHYYCTGCEGDYGPGVCQGAVGSCWG